jgi:hypothetical protein
VLHPIYSATGDYPPVMKKWMAKKNKEEGYSRSRLPNFIKEEIEMVKGGFYFRAKLELAKRKGIFLVKINISLNTGSFKNSKLRTRNERSTL